MKSIPKKYQVIFAALILVLTTLPAGAAAENVRTSYLYSLSDFSGVVPYGWVNVFPDNKMGEIYVTDVADNSVRIFNQEGMEIYSFGDDGSLGIIYDVTLDNKGNILVLSYDYHSKYSVLLANFRAELLSKIDIKNLPAGFEKEFRPTEILYRDGHIYLVDKGSMRVVLTDSKGLFEKSYDLFSVLKLEGKKRYDIEISGFSIDKDGNMLFTVPVIFKAFRYSPDGKLAAFGQRGGAPGKFNVISGIAEDDKGNLYVADVLKSAVLVFDKDLKFVTQFSQRGLDPGDLVAPKEIAYQNGKLYVTQSMNRGVSVFGINYE